MALPVPLLTIAPASIIDKDWSPKDSGLPHCKGTAAFEEADRFISSMPTTFKRTACSAFSICTIDCSMERVVNTF